MSDIESLSWVVHPPVVPVEQWQVDRLPFHVVLVRRRHLPQVPQLYGLVLGVADEVPSVPLARDECHAFGVPQQSAGRAPEVPPVPHLAVGVVGPCDYQVRGVVEVSDGVDVVLVPVDGGERLGRSDVVDHEGAVRRARDKLLTVWGPPRGPHPELVLLAEPHLLVDVGHVCDAVDAVRAAANVDHVDRAVDRGVDQEVLVRREARVGDGPSEVPRGHVLPEAEAVLRIIDAYPFVLESRNEEGAVAGELPDVGAALPLVDQPLWVLRQELAA
mmetsp:Transcript_37921/g.90066  ORF Transcript_37921/g.90066 Transcript_37921/m.90066 type:complete len:273 (+) Transcript_37921:542-1360(+)